MKRYKRFTLIEVLITMCLFVYLSSSIFFFIRYANQIRKYNSEQSKQYTKERVWIDRMDTLFKYYESNITHNPIEYKLSFNSKLSGYLQPDLSGIINIELQMVDHNLILRFTRENHILYEDICLSNLISFDVNIENRNQHFYACHINITYEQDTRHYIFFKNPNRYMVEI